MKERPFADYLARLIWLSVIPLVLVAAVMAVLTTLEHKRDMQERANHLVQNAVNEVDGYLDARIKALGILAASSFADNPDHWGELYQLALDFQASFESPVLFADTGEPMRMVFNTRSPFGQELPSVPKPVGHAAAPTALETGRPAVGDTFIGPITGTKLVAIAVPGIREGEVRHILISPMETSEFQSRLAELSLPARWRITLVDGVSDIIARTEPSDPSAFAVEEETVRYRDELDFAPWSITVEIPQSAYTEPLWREAIAFSVVIALAMFAGVVWSRRAGSRLTRQVQALSSPAQRMPSAHRPIKEITQVQERLRRGREQLEESERRHRELFETNPHPMWIYDLETLEFLDVNESSVAQYGYSRDDFLRMTIKDIRPSADVQRLLANVSKVSEGLNDTGSTWRHLTKGGKLLDVEIMSHFLFFEGRRAELVLAHDVTEQKRAEIALQTHAKQQLLVAKLGQLALSSDAIDDVFDEADENVAVGLGVRFSKVVLVDSYRSTFVMKAGKGWQPGWEGCDVSDSLDQRRATAVFRSGKPLVSPDVPNDSWFAESQLMKNHGIASGVDILIGRGDNPLGILGAYSDEPRHFSEQDLGFLQGIANILAAAIERQRSDDQLNYMAVHDLVTDLPNRLLLTDRVEVALHHAGRSGEKVALLLLDLDRFKNVNDVFGHSQGDRLLHEVAQRLSSCVRAEDTVSRQNGDEFIIVLPEIEDEQDAARIAEKLIKVLTSPFTINEHEVTLGATVGIVLFPDNGEDVETLIRNADAAMKAAQGLGRNRYQFYSPVMNLRALELISLESDLQFAVEREELFLMYQPQINLASHHINGLEALVRWRHPTRGLVSPAHFIPVAEEGGLIVEIGTWVLKTACHQHSLWIRQGVTSGTIAVNVSAHQFRQPDFIDTVKQALSQADLEPEYLELELTESVVMHGIDEVLHKLEELDQLGVKLAIDDFGTGYSSLSYLKQFPLFRLKIDQSFTRALPDDEEGGAIAEAIIQMGHTLDLEVIAEGIETSGQERYLRSLSCDSGQGYLYAKPLGVDECTEYLRKNGNGVPNEGGS